MSSPASKIDVCIPTWNSGKTLDSCLKSIIQEIPANCIRIVDNFSSDDTLRIAKKYKTSVLQRRCGIGKARQILIESVTTDFFAFIDSDAVLRKGWFDAMMDEMKSNQKIGVVGGLFFDDNPQNRHFWEVSYARMRPDDPMWERGYLISALMRTQAVKGISIPEWMINYEDKFIREFIRSNGFRWVITKRAICDHLVGESGFWETIRGKRYFGACLKSWKGLDPNVSWRNFLLEGLRTPAIAFYAALRTEDPLIIPFKLLTLLYTIFGYATSRNELMDKIENDQYYKMRLSKFIRE